MQKLSLILLMSVIPIGCVLADASDTSGFNGSFAFTSNYVWRGVSQTNNGPAAQGGINYNFKDGIHVGIWGSNVDYNDDSGATSEIDYLIGYASQVSDNLSYAIYLYRYTNPKTQGLDFNELFVSGTYDIFTGLISYSNDVFHTGKSSTYYSLGINYDIPKQCIFNLEDVSVNAAIGHYQLPDEAGNSYNDYLIGINKQFAKIYTLSVNYTDTNGKYDNYPGDKAHLFATVSVNF